MINKNVERYNFPCLGIGYINVISERVGKSGLEFFATFQSEGEKLAEIGKKNKNIHITRAMLEGYIIRLITERKLKGTYGETSCFEIGQYCEVKPRLIREPYIKIIRNHTPQLNEGEGK